MDKKPLKLFVIAHANRGPGASSVGLNLLKALCNFKRDIEITGVLPTGYGYEDTAGKNPMSVIWFDQKGSYSRRLFFDTVTLPGTIRRLEPDAILALGNVGISKPRVPQAILVHDAHYVYPRRHYGPMTAMQHLRYFIQGQQIKHCIKQSSILYCQTATMLKHIEKTFGKRQRIEILPNSLSAALFEGPETTEFPPTFKPFKDRFRLICLTRYYPHKNLESIVETFIRNRELLRDVVVFITIAAGQHPNAKRLLDKIHRCGLSNHIVNLGPVEQHRIPAYFRNCHAMLFPSLLESFSATYLEAMQLDLPILTSDLDFAHEICGPAAFYFDPWSTQSIADAIVGIHRDADLRSRLVLSGRDRIKTVHSQSWNDIARTIVSDLSQLVFNKER